MKKLFVKLLLFSAPILVIFIYVEFKLKHIPNSYTVKKKFLDKESAKIQTLVVGSSQALYAINPDYFSSTTLNLANASQSIFFDCALIEKYITSLPNLKQVIIPINYFSYYYDMNDSREKMRTYAYYHFFKIKNHNFSYWDAKNYSLISLLGIKRTITVAKYNFKQLDEESVTNITAQGFLPMDSCNNQTRINDSLGKLRFTYHTTLINSKNLENNIKYLNKLLSNLSLRKIKVYFITIPTYKTYYKNCDNNIIAKSDSITNTLCKRYKCSHFNWSIDTIFSIKDFYDNDHLNKYGATKFSKLLDSAIKSNN